MTNGQLGAAGRVFIGVAFVAFGLLHLIHGDFVTRVVPDWPEAIQPVAAWARLLGVILAAGGVVIVTGPRRPMAAAIIGSLLFVSFLLSSLPLAATDGSWGGLWTVAGKTLALGGGAFLVARQSLQTMGATASAGLRAKVNGIAMLGPWCFGAFLVLCGIQHFIHDTFVATLVPAWIPGPMFWTYTAGVALIAGGIGVVVPATARLAGLLTGSMILAWFIVLHIPRALDAATRSTNETVAVFEALAMSGIGFLIAATSRDRGSVSA
jgi:uncharacterized membrane protein